MTSIKNTYSEKVKYTINNNKKKENNGAEII
jgi:hypothetical protein